MTADQDGPPKSQVVKKKTKFSMKRTKMARVEAKVSRVSSEQKVLEVDATNEVKSAAASISTSSSRAQSPVEDEKTLRTQLSQSWDECVSYLLVPAKLLEVYLLKQELDEVTMEAANH